MKRQVRALICAALVALLWGATAQAGEEHSPWKASLLSRLVDVNDVKFHQSMLQRIARGNDNNRAAGTTGYEQSSEYVGSWLKMAGYHVDIQRFKFDFFQELSDPLLQRTSPEAEPYKKNSPRGFYTMTYSGSGDVEESVVAVDVVMPPGPTADTSNSGCEAEDFAGFPAGAIALVQRGGCSFYDKGKNAQDAGASALIVYNEGQVGRTDAFSSTLEKPEFTIPAVFASYAIGRELYELGQKEGVRVHITTDTSTGIRTTWNVLASTRTGDPSRQVIVGAHLDSAIEGPGINDNGSGAAAVLETAVKMAWAGIRPKNKVTFAFWGAEEEGLLGSSHYVSKLTLKERDGIALYLNFDMIGSPNWIRFVSDGDGSDTPMAGPPGSDFIERVFVDYFKSRNMPTEPDKLDGRSDYGPFMAAGIPIGGVYTGADEIKTKRQAAIYGGTAGKPCDPNYHTPRDTLKNANLTIEEQMLSAIGYAVGYFADRAPTVPEAGKMRTAGPFSFEYRGPLAVR